MIRFVYNLLWPIGLFFFLPGYFVKMIRRGGYREKFGQRLGIYDHELRVRLSKQKSTWLHAVSVGEVNIALKLANALRVLEPDLKCVLTTTTTTGFSLANKSAPAWIEVLYTPLDYWPIMRRAFSVISPKRVLLVEAEVWPNLVSIAHASRVPTALVNARLSPRSEKRFRRFRFFVAPTFRLLDLICAQEPEDIDRWVALGVRPDRIRAVGSIKYDPNGGDQDSKGTGISQQYRFGNANRQDPVLFGGSTHRGEEEILATMFLRLRQQFPSLRLFIAPRHVERLREIHSMLAALPLRVAPASEVVRQMPSESDVDCVLLDTTGELQRWYPIATIVFIGKSLTAHGGQNPVEPILAGKPVVFGPHMENFAPIAKGLLLKRGAIQVGDIDSFERTIAELLQDSAARECLVQNAREVLSKHEGATARTAAVVYELESVPVSRARKSIRSEN
jgi:3-deoxy-D-manno-octulosonic-acid transferase